LDILPNIEVEKAEKGPIFGKIKNAKGLHTKILMRILAQYLQLFIKKN
jgi:hypothetical protein